MRLPDTSGSDPELRSPCFQNPLVYPLVYALARGQSCCDIGLCRLPGAGFGSTVSSLAAPPLSARWPAWCGGNVEHAERSLSFSEV
ncbi:hypothetical protein TREES_T100018769 [Tupaia chinensis]|uniref:Uncharacterized protein n=1 Tax=Tupaia chinensis TaxID=246437 RepID=L9JJI2_TUPCH|nr:hypothetical protein TREES_T100018769 [Tupaia chinensis]